jgi:TP901 family phage tail tape measure protein
MAVVGSAYIRLLPMTAGFAEAAKAELQPELDAIAAETSAATEAAGNDAGAALAGGMAAGAKDGEHDVEDAAAGLAGAGRKGLEDVADDADKAGKDAAAKFSKPFGNGAKDITNSLSGLQHPFASVGKLADGLASKMVGASAQGDNAFGKLARAGALTTAGLVAGAVVAGAAAVKMGLDFQNSVAKLAAASGDTIRQASAIGQAFLNTGGQTIFTAQEMVEAFSPVSGLLNTLEGHTLSAAQATTFMHTASQLAEASNTSLGTSTQILAQTMQAYGAKAKDAGLYSDVLYNTSRVTGQGIDTLGATFQKLHSTLGAVTPDIGQLGGMLIDLTEHGETGRKALSAINTSLNGLLTPTAAVTKAQQELGVNVFNAQGQFVGFGSVIDQLQPKLAGMTEQQQLATLKAIGFGTANKALLTTILSGSGAYDTATAAASRQGAAQEAAAKQTGTLSHQWDELKASAIDLGTKVGTKLLPYLKDFIHILTEAATYLLQHKQLLLAVAAALGVLIAVPVVAFIISIIGAIGPLGFALAGVVTVITLLVTHFGVLRGLMIAGAVAVGVLTAAFIVLDTVPIVVLIVGIAVALAGLVAGIYYLATHWKEVWADIKHWFDDAWGFIKDHIYILIPILGIIPVALIEIALHWKAIWKSMSDAVMDVVNVVRPIVALLVSVVEGSFRVLAAIVSAVMDPVVVVFQTAWDLVVTIFDTAVGVITGIVKFFAALFTGNWTALWNAVKSIVSAVLDGTVGVIKTVFNGLVSFFTSIWAGIRGIFTAAVHAIEGVLSAAWSLVRITVTAVWDGIVTFFTALPGRILGALADLGSLLLGWITSALNGVKNFITTTWDTEVAFFEALPGRILSALGSLGALLLGWIQSAISGVVGYVQQAWANEVAFFSALPGRILGALGSLGSLLVGWITTAFAALSSALSGAVASVLSFFTGLPGQILGALGDAGSLLVGWGKDLISGIANGVTGAAGTIGHALVSAVTGAVGDVKNAVNNIPVIGGALSAIGLATGGYVTRPTLALVGEDGPEFVIPEAEARSHFAAGVAPLPSDITAPVATAAMHAGAGGGEGMMAASAALTTYQQNVSALSTATGLAVPYVSALADSLGIKLKKSLDPDQIVKFTQAVKDQGGAAGVAGSEWEAAAAKIQKAIVNATSEAVKAMPYVETATRDAIAHTQPALVGLVADLNKTGDKAGGVYVSSFLSHLTQAQLAGHSVHNAISSPLLPLEAELRSVGDKAAANQIAAFISHVPAATAAAYTMRGAIVGPSNDIARHLKLSGDQAGENLVESFLSHHPAALAAANEVRGGMASKLAPLKADLLAVGDSSGAAFVAGIMKHDADTNNAAKFYHDALKHPLDPLEMELGASGNAGANALIQEFIKHHPAANTAAGAMHDAIHGKLNTLAVDLGKAGDDGAAGLVSALSRNESKAGDGGKAVGKAVGDGVVAGINGANSAIDGAITTMVNNAVSTAKANLKASSPSLVFADIGTSVPQGFAAGVTAQARLATAATESLVRGVVGATAGMWDATPLGAGALAALTERANAAVSGLPTSAAGAGTTRPGTGGELAARAEQQLLVLRQAVQLLGQLVELEKGPNTLTLVGRLPGSNAVQEIATGIAR